MKPLKQRRIFNGDSCTFFYNPELWSNMEGPFTKQVIHDYIDLIAKGRIDTFMINPNTQLAWYPSQAIPYLLERYKRGDREFFRGMAECSLITEPEAVERYLDHSVRFYDQYVDLTDAGVDWVEETAKACRRNGISPWVSIRMNDMHGHLNFEGSFFNGELIRNPENRLKNNLYSPYQLHPTGTEGINYELKEVRDYMFALIRELVEDYDYEGLELDWLRKPLCCSHGCSQETIDTMTEWFAEIRELTRKRERETGRPYPFGMRIVGSLNLNRSIGIDIAELVRLGIIDFVAPSNQRQTAWEMPHDQLRAELGEDVTIYGVVEDIANWMKVYDPNSQQAGVRVIPGERELMAANIAGKLALGADAVEYYNYVCQPDKEDILGQYEALHMPANLEMLRGLPKLYMLATLREPEWHFPYEITGQLPVILEPEWRRVLRLPMCQEPDGMELTIQIVIQQSEVDPYIGLMLNGSFPTFESRETQCLLVPNRKYTHHVPEHTAYDFDIDASLLRDGWNEVTVYNGTPGWKTLEEKMRCSIRIEGIECYIRPRALQKGDRKA